MKLERGRLSKGECVAMAITCIAAFFIITFGPNLYLSITGQVRENNAQILPEHGTIEYEQFRQDFQAEYGREWTVQDDLNAMKNGAHVMIGIITSIMAAGALFSMVHDLRCWNYEKRMYQSKQTTEPPMCAKNPMDQDPYIPEPGAAVRMLHVDHRTACCHTLELNAIPAPRNINSGTS